MRESQEEGGGVAPFPPAREGSGRKTAVAIPATSQPNSHDGRPRSPPPRPGPQRRRPAPSSPLPPAPAGTELGAALAPAAPHLRTRTASSSAVAAKQEAAPQARRATALKRALQPGEARQAPRRVRRPRQPRARVSAGGGDRRARSPVRPPARPAPGDLAHLPAPVAASGPSARGAPSPGASLLPFRLRHPPPLPPGRFLCLLSALRELSRLAAAGGWRRQKERTSERGAAVRGRASGAPALTPHPGADGGEQSGGRGVPSPAASRQAGEEGKVSKLPASAFTKYPVFFATVPTDHSALPTCLIFP